jgi:hypothetical protein
MGAALGPIEVGQAKLGHAAQPEQLRALHPAVPGDDLIDVAQEPVFAPNRTLRRIAA